MIGKNTNKNRIRMTCRKDAHPGDRVAKKIAGCKQKARESREMIESGSFSFGMSTIVIFVIPD